MASVICVGVCWLRTVANAISIGIVRGCWLAADGAHQLIADWTGLTGGIWGAGLTLWWTNWF